MKHPRHASFSLPARFPRHPGLQRLRQQVRLPRRFLPLPAVPGFILLLVLVLPGTLTLSCRDQASKELRTNPASSSTASSGLSVSRPPVSLWIPMAGDEEAFAASGCPWNGKGISAEAREEWMARIRHDLSWPGAGTDGSVLAGIFTVPFWHGNLVLIRQPGDDPFFESSLTLAVAEAEGKILGSLEASEYVQGESGGWYTQTWLVGPGPDGFPLLLGRSAGFNTPGPHNDSDETVYWNSFTLLVHQGDDWHRLALPDLSCLKRLFPLDDPPSCCPDMSGE